MADTEHTEPVTTPAPPATAPEPAVVLPTVYARADVLAAFDRVAALVRSEELAVPTSETDADTVKMCDRLRNTLQALTDQVAFFRARF